MIHKGTILEIILSKWVPALIIAVIGGVFVALIVPGIQTKYTDISQYKQRQMSLWETTGQDFTKYIISRSKLNSVAKEQLKRENQSDDILKKLSESKKIYLKDRDKFAINLRHDLLMSEHMFSDKVKKVIHDFIEWHKQYATAEIDKQPKDEIYISWRDKILREMAVELGR